jgi:hypothetical protein
MARELYVVTLYYYCAGEPDDSDLSIQAVCDSKQVACNLARATAEELKDDENREHKDDNEENDCRYVVRGSGHQYVIFSLGNESDETELDMIHLFDFVEDGYGDRWVVKVESVRPAQVHFTR